jgi:hypothetical protein
MNAIEQSDWCDPVSLFLFVKYDFNPKIIHTSTIIRIDSRIIDGGLDSDDLFKVLFGILIVTRISPTHTLIMHD